MKETPNLTTHETGLPKYYSKRKFVASFKADPELWSKFKEECRLRGVSICHVLEALMAAWIEGQKATATVIKPVVVNLTMEHVVERPRRSQTFEGMLLNKNDKNWPPPCPYADEYLKSSREVGCLKFRDWVPLSKCWRCYLLKRSPEEM